MLLGENRHVYCDVCEGRLALLYLNTILNHPKIYKHRHRDATECSLGSWTRLDFSVLVIA